MSSDPANAHDGGDTEAEGTQLWIKSRNDAMDAYATAVASAQSDLQDARDAYVAAEASAYSDLNDVLVVSEADFIADL